MSATPTATVRIANWSARHPWRAIGAWVVFVALCIGLGSVAGTRTVTPGQDLKGELAQFDQIVKESKLKAGASENVLISSLSGALDPEKGTAVAEEVRSRMSALPVVAKVGDPVPSPKGTAVLLDVEITGDPATAGERLQPLLDATAAIQKAHPELRVEQVGDQSMTKALSATIGDDFRMAEFVSIPVTLVIMLVVFGAIVAAGVPVLLALSAVGSALGLAALVSQLVPATENTQSMVLLIGMAVGVDYSLFYIKREREERARGAGKLNAVAIAAATSGHAIVVSGVAVMVAMAGMFVADDPTFSSMAIGSILVVLVAVIGSLTVLPAMLVKLGGLIDRPRVPLVWRLTARSGEPRIWKAVLRPSLRRPAVALVVAVGALVALAVPAANMRLVLPDQSDLPDDLPIMQTYDRLTQAFPSTGAAHAVVVRAPADKIAPTEAAVADLVGRIQRQPGFATDRAPLVVPSADGRTFMISAAFPGNAASVEADNSLAWLRTTALPATVGTVKGAEFAVSGQTAGTNDFIDRMGAAMPWVVTIVLVLTFLVMLWTFRSPVIALSSILLNLLSAGAAYGILVLVFQNTWAEGLLGFISVNGIVAWLPLVLFVVLFGLSMDYHVFVVSRIREARMSGLDNRAAVAKGITNSAGVVTSAAVVMVAVFSIFATLTTIDMKMMGVGLAAAVLLDATIIRGVVLPSLMAVLGERNWSTPRFMRRAGTPEPAAEETRELDLVH